MRPKSTITPAYPQPVPDRPCFWDNVDLSNPEHCWRWLGRMVNKTPHLGNQSARRIAYHACRGALPRGTVRLRPACGDSTCINPDHARVQICKPKRTPRAANTTAKRKTPYRGRLISQLSEVELRRFLIHPIEDLPT